MVRVWGGCLVSGALAALSGAGGLGGVVSVTDRTVSASDLSFASAQYQLMANGDVKINGSIIEQYCVPAAIAPLLECRMTVTSGSLSSGGTGSWIALTADRSWALTQSGTGVVNATATIEIREAATGLVRTSATLSFQAQVT